MARERYGLEIDAGPFGIDSRLALRGAKFAEAQGAGAAYHDAVFRAYWQQARSVADTAVLADIAVSLGLDRDEFLAALVEEQWETAVAADIEQARAYGLSGVPALVFGKKYLVVGAQPLAALAEVVEKVMVEME